jgi:tetratricopeptide (TPR) repeat protein
MTVIEAMEVCFHGAEPARQAAAMHTLQTELRRASGQPYLERSMLEVLASCHMRFGDYNAAAQRYGEILEAVDRRGEPQGTHYADALRGQARAYEGLRRYEEAGLRYQQALAIKERVLDLLHPEIASLLTDLGRTYYRTEKYQEAELAFAVALSILEVAYSKDDARLAPVLENMLRLYVAMGRPAEADEVRARVSALQGG